MKYFILGTSFLLFHLCGAKDLTVPLGEQQWVIPSQQVDEQTTEWLKHHLQTEIPPEHLLKNPLQEKKVKKEQCLTCGNADLDMKESSSLYICMSFSLEDQLWIQLSKEAEKVGALFIIRGLPNNSFKELASRILQLQEKGINVPIQIHPKLFKDYQIKCVPAVLVVENEKYDVISGNVSLQFALEKLSQQGETQLAKTYFQQIKRGNQ